MKKLFFIGSLAVAGVGVAINSFAEPRDNALRSAAKKNAASSEPKLRASSVPGVNVRFAPATASKSGTSSIYVRPGSPMPRSFPGAARIPNKPLIRALPGGGRAARLDRSWHTASRAVIVNGKMQMLCVEPAHGAKSHYHDATGRHDVK